MGEEELRTDAASTEWADTGGERKGLPAQRVGCAWHDAGSRRLPFRQSPLEPGGVRRLLRPPGPAPGTQESGRFQPRAALTLGKKGGNRWGVCERRWDGASPAVGRTPLSGADACILWALGQRLHAVGGQ